MTKEQVVESVSAIRNGSYAKVTYITDIPLKDKFAGHSFRRVTTAIVRIGVNYTHMKNVVVSEGAAHLPSWQKWDDEYGYLLHYVGKDETKKGTIYLRVALSKGKYHSPKVVYEYDGRVLHLDPKKEKHAKLLELASRTNKGHPDSVMSINIANIISINQRTKGGK